MRKSLKISEIEVGDKESFSKTISERDVYDFAGITGDFNPIHINKEYAKTTRFGERISHGMLIGSFFSTVFGTLLPGLGSIYLSQDLQFVSPVKIGDTITSIVEVLEKKMEKKTLRFSTLAVNQNNETVIKGSATIKVPE